MAIDLCCGMGGWTNGLLEAGFRVIGYDIERWEGYRGELVVMDIRKFDATDLKGLVSVVCASPPCQEFSYRSFPFKRCRYLAENVPPDKSIWEACVRIAKECGAPLILENVRGAVKYMGKAKFHVGSFYLWGDVPALLPTGNPRKGFSRVDVNFQGQQFRGGDGKQFRGNTPIKGETFAPARTKAGFAGEMDRINPVYKYQDMPKQRDKYTGMNGTKNHSGNARKEWSAKAAIIPIDLSRWIGKCFYPKVV